MNSIIAIAVCFMWSVPRGAFLWRLDGAWPSGRLLVALDADAARELRTPTVYVGGLSCSRLVRWDNVSDDAY